MYVAKLLLVMIVLIGQIYLITSVDEYDAHLTLMQLLNKYDYPNAEHYVTTKDGYIINLVEIAPLSDANPDQVVLIGHTTGASAANFILTGPDRALPYLLSNRSATTFLINFRGSTYSTNHTNMSASDPSFWKFSMHEMGVYDLSAVIDYIRDVKNASSVAYVCHGDGCAAAFILLAKDPSFNDKIKLMINYGPGIFVKHAKCVYNLLAQPLISSFIVRSGIDRWNMHGLIESTRHVRLDFCTPAAPLQPLCATIYRQMYDFASTSNDPLLTYILIGHSPSSFSIDSALQIAQFIKTGEFAAFDPSFNYIGKTYNLDNVKVPIYIFNGALDHYVPPVDVEWLVGRLGDNLRNQTVLAGFAHGDFLMAERALADVYEPTLRILSQAYNGTN